MFRLVFLSLLSISLMAISCSEDENQANGISNPVDPNLALSNVICQNGIAAGYSCNGVDILSTVPLINFGAATCNDSWGWIDTQTSKEYALLGLNNGTAFIDISDPLAPIYLGKLPTHTTSSQWRDIKIHNDYAYVVSEASDHGMQIFDLKRLRDVTNPPVNFNSDMHYNGFGNAHNLIINEDTGFAYALGTQTFNGGPHFINIQNPLNPIAAGGYAMNGYSHDAQVVTYNGPDNDYQGAEILIGSNENEVVIANVSDKENPLEIATINYSEIGYTHQGWFTEDQRFFILGDELDERNIGVPTRTLIFDFEDLDNPSFHYEYLGPTNAVDHNGYVKDTKFYLANYTAGIRIIDINNIENQQFTETAFFDTYPLDDNAAFSGAWNIYPFLPSGTLIVSDINSGLFLLKQQ